MFIQSQCNSSLSKRKILRSFLFLPTFMRDHWPVQEYEPLRGKLGVEGETNQILATQILYSLFPQRLMLLWRDSTPCGQLFFCDLNDDRTALTSWNLSNDVPELQDIILRWSFEITLWWYIPQNRAVPGSETDEALDLEMNCVRFYCNIDHYDGNFEWTSSSFYRPSDSCVHV